MHVNGDFFIINRPFEKQVDTYPAPYVDVSISPLAGQEPADIIRFKARVDTGADITIIPREQAERLMPLFLCKPIRVRGHNGRIERVWTYWMIVSIHGYPDRSQMRAYRPERGVLLTDSDTGLIGMDIIKHWELTIDGASQRFSVKTSIGVKPL